jgi:hypothetical protein
MQADLRQGGGGMTTKAITCYTLHCDASDASDDCAGKLVDGDTEATIHATSPQEIRSWATGRDYEYDWVHLADGRDVCPDCRVTLARHPHPFMADTPAWQPYPFCALCGEPPIDDDQLHDHAEVPGQLEIPGAVTP